MDVYPEHPVDPNFTQQVGPVGEGRIRRSWRLTQVAFDVIRREPRLIGIALIQMAFTLAAAALLFVAAAGAVVTHTIYGTTQVDQTKVALIGIIASFPLTFISVFFGVVMASAASAALRGKHVSIRDAVGVACSRIGDIVIWTIITWLVGVVLRAVIDRIPMGGRLLSFLVGLAWAIATFFAIPVLTLEGASGADAAKRSAELVRRRWGEQISGTVIISAWFGIAFFGLVFVGFVAVAAAASVPALAALLAVVGVLAFVALIAINGAVRSVFSVALYRYARDGEAIGGFSAPDLASPFVPKRGSKSRF
jgi:Family of unknown function (DUF6159)